MAQDRAANLFKGSFDDKRGLPEKNWWKDDSYNTWKGGAKLKEQLTAFYTSKRATERIAKQNSFGAATPAATAPVGTKPIRGLRNIIDARQVGRPDPHSSSN